MNVFEFVEMCTEPQNLTITIYNMNNGDTHLYKGDEIQKSWYLDCEICSFDTPENDIITLNIDEEE